MESLKEKNKKHARRFGMSKKSLVGLALGTVGLMGLVYNYVQAGSITAPSSDPLPKKVAKELVDAAAVNATITFSNSTYKYKPSDIQLGILDNPTILVSVDNGKIYASDSSLAICNATNNGTVAIVQSGGSGTNQLVFSNISGAKIINGNEYWIGGDNGSNFCNRTADLTFEIPRGASSVTLTIRAGASNQVYDTASAQIIRVAPEFSASVDSKLSKKIDSAHDFKKFEGGSTSDNGTIKLNSESLYIRVQQRATSNATNFIVTLKPTDMAGIANATINNGTNNFDCNKTTDRFICNATHNATAGNTTFTIYVNVNGTDVISEKSFKVDALLDFSAGNVADQTFFTNVDFGAWTYKGTTIYVPIIGHDPEKGRFTTIRLQSRDTSPNANKVTALILASDGSVVTADLGQITAGQPFTITGGDLKAKVEAAGKTVGDTFAAILVVMTVEDNLFAYAVFDHQGVSRRVPLKVKGGTIVE
jgi:hypothetical protein